MHMETKLNSKRMKTGLFDKETLLFGRFVYFFGKTYLFPAFVLAFLASGIAGATTPSWVGEPSTTAQIYRFTTNNPNPLPEELANPHGLPEAVVSVNPPQGEGWFGPNSFFPGVDNEGTWDLGPSPDGFITVTLPFAPPQFDPGLFYELELFIYLVAYEIPVALPEVVLPGLEPTNVSSSVVTVKQDTIGRYRGLTWTASVTVPEGNGMTIRFAATASGALVDSIAIHTRYTLAGEPSGLVDSFAAWVGRTYPAETNPAVIGFTASPDGDGLPNGLKYFLGLERGETMPALLIAAFEQSALTLTHPRSKKILPDISARYQWSTDLITWHDSGAPDSGVRVDFTPEVIDESHPDREIVRVIAAVTEGAPLAFFVRLFVTQTNP